MKILNNFFFFCWAVHTHTVLPLASLSVLLFAEEREPCPHHLAMTPTLWDVAAPLETDRVPIIYMPQPYGRLCPNLRQHSFVSPQQVWPPNNSRAEREGNTFHWLKISGDCSTCCWCTVSVPPPPAAPPPARSPHVSHLRLYSLEFVLSSPCTQSC